MVVEVEGRSAGYKRYRPTGHQLDAWAFASDPSIAKRNYANIASHGTRRLGDLITRIILHLMKSNADKPISAMAWQTRPRERSRIAVRPRRVPKQTGAAAAARFIDGTVERAASPDSADRVNREDLPRMKNTSSRSFNLRKVSTEEDRESP